MKLFPWTTSDKMLHVHTKKYKKSTASQVSGQELALLISQISPWLFSRTLLRQARHSAPNYQARVWMDSLHLWDSTAFEIEAYYEFSVVVMELAPSHKKLCCSCGFRSEAQFCGTKSLFRRRKLFPSLTSSFTFSFTLLITAQLRLRFPLRSQINRCSTRMLVCVECTFGLCHITEVAHFYRINHYSNYPITAFRGQSWKVVS